MPVIRCLPFRPTRFYRMRFTITNSCGAPIFGPESTWVTGMPMSVQITRNSTEAEDMTATLPDGTPCWTLPGRSGLQSYTLTLAYCEIDPAFRIALNNGLSPVHNYLFNVVGWDERNQPGTNRVAVEGWMERPPGDSSACADPDSIIEGEWGYLGFYNVAPFDDAGDVTYGTEVNPWTIVAEAAPGAAWGRGPYDIQMNPGAPPTPGPWITPVPGDDGKRVATVDVEPPEPTCGPRPLSNPNAPRVLFSRGANSMEVCVSLIDDVPGTWVVDFGDGSPTQTFNADEEVCYQYTEEGCVNIGVWAEGNPQLYRGQHFCLPQNLTLNIEPDSGEVPLDVLATIGGASGISTPVMDWGD